MDILNLDVGKAMKDGTLEEEIDGFLEELD